MRFINVCLSEGIDVGIQQIYMSKLHTFLLFCRGLEESPLRGAVSPKPSAANYDCLAEKRMFETELIDS